MANKAKAKTKPVNLDDEVQYGETLPEETVITMPRGGAVGIAIRTAETATEFRALITIRFGTMPEKIQFNFGTYGSGPQVRGGGDGSPPDPPCP